LSHVEHVLSRLLTTGISYDTLEYPSTISV
jgi:hypothetical protein